MRFYTFNDPKEAYFAMDDVLPEGAKEISFNSTDAALEKHVPEVKVEDKMVVVEVGSVAHPMLDVHYIKWILLENGDQIQVKALKPGDKPEARFPIDEVKAGARVFSFCNLHGLWVKAL